MKNTLTLLLLLITLALSAQYQRGDWYLSGVANVGLSVPVGDNASNVPGFFAIDAFRLGRFVTDRLLIGVSPYFTVRDGAAFSDGSVGLSFRPYARYYFPSGNNPKISFFAGGNLGDIAVFGGERFFTANYGLGGGGEWQIAPGLLATARLSFNRFETVSRNFVNLFLGANVLFGRLKNTPVTLRRGMITSGAGLGSVGSNWGQQNGNSSSNFSFGLSPEAGYFLTDRLMSSLGFGLSYQVLRTEGTAGFSDFMVTRVETRLAPQVRYYLRVEGKLLPFAFAGASWSVAQFNTRSAGGQSSRGNALSTLIMEGGLGGSYFLSPAVSFEGLLFYEYSGFDNNNSFDGRRWTSRLRLQCGFRFFIDRISRSE